MKALSKITLTFIVSMMMVVSACEKDETITQTTSGTASTISSSANTVVLAVENADNEALSITWSNADYGFKAAVKYVVQMDKKGNNFASPKEYSIDPGVLKHSFKVADLNNSLNLMGLTPGVAAVLEVRVKSTVASTIAPVYSNVTELTLTPYPIIIVYPSVNVPGAQNGWNVKTDKVASVYDNKIYEGYVNFPDPSALTFKYNIGDVWYGWASSTNTDSYAGGTFNTTGGNLFVPSAGYYLMKADFNANTWSAEKVTFGIVGDAVAGWEADTEMTYDATEKVWKVTANFNAGPMKFRANHKWDLNYGDNKPANGFLKVNGENIQVPVAGNYTVVLDLSNPGNYRFSLTKN
ncbi:SusE domain-containing protein [Solitalea sp. MAHUQ-68]|uniref:SusE domain-containing protein n=1 Tax=Solitalea agri TaxID=2953739 RepID=A0A9X2F8G1_9SPHI|nr:SusE domain-containing protein [Solitalea agri]MCO4294256.1 SusE domain-containing protein [Solitalea agri]